MGVFLTSSTIKIVHLKAQLHMIPLEQLRLMYGERR